MNEKFCLSITILLKCVPKGPIDNNPALVKIRLAAESAKSHFYLFILLFKFEPDEIYALLAVSYYVRGLFYLYLYLVFDGFRVTCPLLGHQHIFVQIFSNLDTFYITQSSATVNSILLNVNLSCLLLTFPFSALLAICAENSPVSSEFPTQRPVTRSFDVFFDLRLNKRLSKQSRGWWFEMLSRPFWRHCNDIFEIRSYFLTYSACSKPMWSRTEAANNLKKTLTEIYNRWNAIGLKIWKIISLYIFTCIADAISIPMLIPLYKMKSLHTWPMRSRYECTFVCSYSGLSLAFVVAMCGVMLKYAKYTVLGGSSRFHVMVSPWLLSNYPDYYIVGLVPNCSITSALVMEILQSCTKPSISLYH